VCSVHMGTPTHGEGSLAETLLHSVGTVLGVTSKGAGFSLVTASWLFDFAWAAYFDVPGYSTPSSFGAFPEGVLLHNFEVSVFCVLMIVSLSASALSVCFFSPVPCVYLRRVLRYCGGRVPA
jgi:hypothetical protein